MSGRTIQSIGVLAAVVVFLSCDAGAFIGPDNTEGGDSPDPVVNSIALDTTISMVTENDTIPLQVTVLDQNDEPMGDVELQWTSTDESVAYVEATGTSEGTLIAGKPGMATITASYASVSTSMAIEVHNRPVDLVYVSGAEQQALTGAALPDSLVARAVDRRGDPVSGIVVEFVVTTGGGSASPTKVRTDADGRVRAAWTLGSLVGQQTVEARASEGQVRVKQMKDSTVVFTAVAVEPLAAVEVTPSTLNLEEGDTVQLQVSAVSPDGSQVPSPQVMWVSSDTSVATISSKGLLRARRTGSARAIVEAAGLAAMVADTASVTVATPAATITGVEVRPATVEVDTGGTQQFDAVALMSDGSQKAAIVTWSATGGTITSGGTFTAGSNGGSFRVVASHDLGYADTASVTVVAVSGTLTMSPAGDTLYGVGDTLTATAVARNADGSINSDPGLQWTSRNPDIATVDSMGRITARALGTAVIAVTAACCGADSGSFVAIDTVTPTGTIQMTPPGDTLYGIGDTLTATAIARAQDGSVIPDPGFEWVSHDPNIATVDSMGRITARALGTAVIAVSAACCGADSGAFLAVDTTSASGTLEMSPASGILRGVGDTMTVTAVARAADGSSIANPGLAWTSRNPDIATVDSMGRITAQSLGTAIITVSAACCGPDSGSFTAIDTTSAQATVLFHSDWSTATGNTDAAIRDTGKDFPWLEVLNNGDALEVVPSTGLDFPTANVLEVNAVAGGAGAYAANPRIWGLPVPGVGESIYYRWYFRSTVPDSYNIDPGSHPIQDYRNGTMGQTNWYFNVITSTNGTWSGGWDMTYTGEAWPNNRWMHTFEKNKTYRFELQLERLSTTSFRVHTRVYDSNNTLLYTDADFRNIESQTNLAAWYQAGNSFTFANVDNLSLFQVGHNDYSGGTASDYGWPISYQGGVAICADDWCGPYGGGG